jgi:hypothetical protein
MPALDRCRGRRIFRAIENNAYRVTIMQTILNSVFWKGACSNCDTFTLVICFPESKAVKRSMIAWRLHSGGPGRLGELSGEMTIALSIFLATNPAS